MVDSLSRFPPAGVHDRDDRDGNCSRAAAAYPAHHGRFVLRGGAAAYDASVLWAYTSIVGNQQITAGSCSEGNRLRLLEVNVQMTNRHDHTLLNIIRQVNPDVAWVQETNDWWTNELSAFKDQMPYHVSKAQPNYFGADLYSRFPLIDPQINYLTESKDPAIFTGVRLPSGQTIKLYAIHPRPPVAGQHRDAGGYNSSDRPRGPRRKIAARRGWGFELCSVGRCHSTCAEGRALSQSSNRPWAVHHLGC